MTLALYGNVHQPSLRELEAFLRTLAAKGFRICLERRFGQYLASSGIPLPPDSYLSATPDGADTVLSIGGDGTFLRAAQWVADREIPILGVNTGHLGFLANYRLDEAAALADAVRRGLLSPEPRILLRLDCDGMPDGFWPYALNEVAILKDDTSAMINVHARIDDIHLGDFQADGFLISTPTGSTGYNLSVGGPILQPGLDAFALTPVAPHSLTQRPLVVRGESVIEATTSTRASHYRVSLDGRSFLLAQGTEISVRKAPFRTSVLRRPGADFASTLRDKLLWTQR